MQNLIKLTGSNVTASNQPLFPHSLLLCLLFYFPAYYTEFLKENPRTGGHITHTCKMGLQAEHEKSYHSHRLHRAILRPNRGTIPHTICYTR
jgi:hypothetical protein